MYDKPYDRCFGIEFEFNMPTLSPIRDGDGYTTKSGALMKLLSDNGMGEWSVGGDGSEFEVRTPILSGPNGFKKVRRFLDVILENGGRVHPTYDGLHVHHDAPEFIGNKEMVLRLVNNWLENQAEILKMARSNRHNSSACRPWDYGALRELDTTFDVQNAYWGRRNLNVSSLRRHGTIEVRLHEGTLDYEEVFSWVRFGQSFIGSVVTESGNILSTSPSDLLRKINISRNASRFIASKVRNNYGSVWA